MKFVNRARRALAALVAVLMTVALGLLLAPQAMGAGEIEIPLPPRPAVSDDPNVCGDAHYVGYENTDKVLWDLQPDGSIHVGARLNREDGVNYIFPDGNRSWAYPPPEDTCPAPVTDTDDDGVPDADDKCPGTPKGQSVNSSGCAASQLDDDDDGVPNSADRCAATPKGKAVDSHGCSASQRDTDADGVRDNVDNCINEPGPASNNGCPVSSPVAADPAVTADDNGDGTVTVTVTNTADDTGKAVEYTVTVGGKEYKVTVPDGKSGSIATGKLPDGEHKVKVEGNDSTSAKTSVKVTNPRDAKPSPEPAGPSDRPTHRPRPPVTSPDPEPAAPAGPDAGNSGGSGSSSSTSSSGGSTAQATITDRSLPVKTGPSDYDVPATMLVSPSMFGGAAAAASVVLAALALLPRRRRQD